MDVLAGEAEQEPGLMWEEAGNNSNNYTRAAAPSTTNSSTMAFVPKGELYTISPPPPPILVALGYGPSNLFQLYSVFVCVSTVSAEYLAGIGFLQCLQSILPGIGFLQCLQSILPGFCCETLTIVGKHCIASRESLQSNFWYRFSKFGSSEKRNLGW